MLNSRFWQGFFALAPFIGLFLMVIAYFVFFLATFSNIEQLENADGPPMEFFGGLAFFIVMIFLMVFISLGSLVFYIVHAVKNPNLKEHNLLLVWILLFVFASGIGQLIYWFVEIIGKRNEGPVVV
ncbi:hypothetical protein ACFQ1M_08845 [Sungkyunkwania multivorans]|uniref:Cardiolipin synthase N-terminal domain-containing protein n=1 Tax=Sungkyunkwania multivorans TaxID=1173618 RepID=A0ABW3CYP1_9FLAO